jgi:hypothetical protein
VLIVVSALVLAVATPALSVTCEECKDLEKKKDEVQHELTQKDKDISAAFEKKQFQRVTQIRNEITVLRKKLIDVRSHDEECKKACRPDIVKELECRKKRSEILKLDTGDSTTDTAKIDALYRELSKCNRELEQLKQTEK